jgi:methionyl-tRNA formyltransferase
MVRVIFCGRKNIAIEAVQKLMENNWDILLIVPKHPESNWMKKPSFQEGLEELGLSYITQKDILHHLSGKKENLKVKEFLEKPVDYVFSYLFPELIKKPLLDLPKHGAINFHPGPLPAYGGMAGYNLAIMDQCKTYAVTAHYMDEQFDTGNIIKLKHYDIDWRTETAHDIEHRGRGVMLSLFCEIIEMIIQKKELPNIKQENMRYTNKEQFEAMKVIKDTDSPEFIETKARAFWYPPFEGAYYVINGSRFTITPKSVLSKLGNDN